MSSVASIDGPGMPGGADLWSCMRMRRQFALRRLLAPGPDASTLRNIFEAAAQAPDHGALVPWRFVLVSEERRDQLGQVFSEALAERDPSADNAARAAAREKAFHAPCLIVAILVDDPAATAVPAAEKLVSLGCAVQNILLAATAAGYQSGLASGASLDAPGMRRLLRLATHERAICFIGLGSGTVAKPPRERPSPERFVSVL